MICFTKPLVPKYLILNSSKAAALAASAAVISFLMSSALIVAPYYEDKKKARKHPMCCIFIPQKTLHLLFVEVIYTWSTIQQEASWG
jgi:hypothetical protein